jgi:energy-coupling factor transporter transmembrane protein EcfT
MIVGKPHASPVRPPALGQWVGSLGYLVIFLWSLGIVLLTQVKGSFLPAVGCVLLLGSLNPSALRRLLHWRWVVILGGILVAAILFGGGSPDLVLWGLPVSSLDMISGAKMVLSAVIILLAVDGLAGSMNVTEIAGVFERFGLQGLGFSLGVGANMLPNLRQSATNAWYSLRMRGGMRAQWLRGLQLLLLTILTNALRHSEDIVLAAESRAYRPDSSRPVPLRIGHLDWWLVPLGLATLVGIFLVA